MSTPDDRHLGRFTWRPRHDNQGDDGDWYPDPDGTHDAHFNGLNLHLTERTDPAP